LLSADQYQKWTAWKEANKEKMKEKRKEWKERKEEGNNGN